MPRAKLSAVSLLETCPPVFKALAMPAWEQLLQHSSVINCARGHSPVQVGQDDASVVAVLRGVTAIRYQASLGEKVVTDFRGPKEYFIPTLETFSLSGAEVLCVSSCSILQIPREAFVNALTGSPEFSLQVNKDLLYRQSRVYFAKAHLSTLPLEAQYAYLMWNLSEPSEEYGRVFSAKIPQNIIASYFGVTREEISRKKVLLEKAGYITQVSAGIALSEYVPVLFYMLSDNPASWEGQAGLGPS